MTQVIYFVNSGSEANDMAMMMARLYSNNYDILALRNAYHGMSAATMGLVAHSTWKFSVPQVCPPYNCLLFCIPSNPALQLSEQGTGAIACMVLCNSAERLQRLQIVLHPPMPTSSAVSC